MKIDIRPDMQITEVQKAFHEMFPFLKLEFYRRPGDIKLGKRMNGKSRIADGQVDVTDTSMEIRPDMTVRTLESNFKTLLTLTVQVFRKTGNVWLQTTTTDDWTLQLQNEHGKEISQGMTQGTAPEPVDFDLDRDASH